MGQACAKSWQLHVECNPCLRRLASMDVGEAPLDRVLSDDILISNKHSVHRRRTGRTSSVASVKRPLFFSPVHFSLLSLSFAFSVSGT